MARQNTVADAMSTLKNASDTGRAECIVQPAGRLIGELLRIMKEAGYIKEYTRVEDGRGGQFKVIMSGLINKCGCISPRYSVSLDEMEYWEQLFLPSKNIGMLMISTSKGVMGHHDARRNGVGGELLGYVY
ncbi:MAG TPA: 30S ribosomal protein S8 [Methanospirillum sp.]|jgi:small subunit ribosomal protein S8|uniref:30S ribosomal protein S8 n=1 Tax=Methanospirillum sp. TaxID=45200 RepID=UPI0009D04DD6|nr:30S ribosomal protein S8 [Methanospirillum sp.]MCZ2415950.1 30S ribosomal protein S8 [Burkholderiales bacterium]OQB38503.1 MAG: 30S ribosomal protein S8 [Euryarchaeota archaeon ADurb.Bin165]HPY59256.1 30S ribosomal protein S8 [Methanospirillum sp.]